MNKAKDIMECFALFLLIGMGISCGKKHGEADPTPPPVTHDKNYDWKAIADSAASTLSLFWYPSKAFYTSNNNTTEWVNYWPEAHALDVLVDAYLRTPSESIKGQMKEVVNGLEKENGDSYLRTFYDDEEWMALAVLRAYNATQDPLYKNIAVDLWTDIKKGWSTDLGGGIWWRKDKPSKNTPSNMPASILAARLYRAFKDPEDSSWAVKIYKWEKSVLYDASTGLVYDNIKSAGEINKSMQFTYNQGTFIGAAQELYAITGTAVYNNDAIQAADYTLLTGQLAKGGMLKDEGGGDGGLFKGIFVRYFTQLILHGKLNSDKQKQYIDFLTNNAKKLWSSGTNKDQILFGSDWTVAPGSTTDFTIQLSGIMLFDAMAELEEQKLVN